MILDYNSSLISHLEKKYLEREFPTPLPGMSMALGNFAKWMEIISGLLSPPFYAPLYVSNF